MAAEDFPERIQDKRLLKGLALLEAREYFEAHEALEDVWRELEKPNAWREVLQGLIQLAVSLEHLRRDNALGAFNVWQRSRAKLKGAPESVAGLGVLAWSEAVAVFFREGGVSERVKLQLEGGVADGAEHLKADDLPQLPPLTEWPAPPLTDELRARLPTSP